MSWFQGRGKGRDSHPGHISKNVTFLLCCKVIDEVYLHEAILHFDDEKGDRRIIWILTKSESAKNYTMGDET